MKTSALKKLGALLTLAAVMMTQSAKAVEVEIDAGSSIDQQQEIQKVDFHASAEQALLQSTARNQERFSGRSNRWLAIESRLLWLTEAFYLQNAIATITTAQPAVKAALLAAINAQIVENSADIGLFLATIHTGEVVAITTFLNQFAAAGEQYATDVAAGAPFPVQQADLNAWFFVANQLAGNLATFSSEVDLSTISSLLKNYVSLEAFQIQNYVSGNYTLALEYNQQASVAAAIIGTYLARTILFEDRSEHPDSRWMDRAFE